MSLEALAPDQRAVVQLVLQQERSYDDLAGLLGISADAVRERARAGLDHVGAATGDLSGLQRGEIADYLLGQQSVSRREATRALLAESRDARVWAREVSGALAPVARSPLPGVPEDDADEDAVDTDIGVGTAALSAPAEAPARTDRDAARRDRESARRDREDETETLGEEREAVSEALGRPVAARPRPRPRPETGGGPASRAPSAAGDRPRASKLGGALLIGGVAIFLAAVIAFIFRPSNDDEPVADATPTATATATPTVTPAAQIPLQSTTGSKAQGAMTIFVSGQQIAFTIEAVGVAPSKKGEAYGVWLTGGGKPKRLGFAPTVGQDGKLGVSGPREGDAAGFPTRFGKATKVVVSVEKSQDSAEPGPLILSGTIKKSGG